MSRGWTVFFCLLAVIVGTPLGFGIGWLHIDDSLSQSISSLPNEVASFKDGITNAAEQQAASEAEQHVPGLQDSYARIHIKHLANTPPLVGPFDNIKQRVDWQGHFEGYMTLLNAKRLAKFKDKLEYKIDFVKPKANSQMASSAKDWSAERTADWIDKHS